MTVFVLRKKKRAVNKKAKHQYIVGGCPVTFVDSSEKIENILRMCEDAWRVGVDTEYVGADEEEETLFGKARMVSMQFTCVGRKVDDVAHKSRYIFIPNWGEYTNTYRHFKKFLEADDNKKVLHAYKNDAHVLANHGINMRGLKADTICQSALYNSGELHALKRQANLRLGIDSPTYKEAFQVPKPLKRGGVSVSQKILPKLDKIVTGEMDQFYPEGGLRRLVEYAVKDPYYTVLLNDYYEKGLRNLEWAGGKHMLDYYYLLDNPFVQVLYRMERAGCLLDEEYLQDTKKQMEQYVEEQLHLFNKFMVKKGISPQELEELNMGSGKQVAELFERIGMELPRTAPSKSFPQGQPSVSADALEKIHSNRFRPVINALTEWRSVNQKLLGTYIIPWIQFVNDPRSDRMLRCEYRFPGTATSRISSAHPNLQNIPRPQEELGGEGDRFHIRRAFIPPKGYEIGDADLSQIELRLMGHFSKDRVMLEALRNEWDLHARTAVMCFPEVQNFVRGKTINKDVLAQIKSQYKTQRQNAKTIAFLIAYGGGPTRYATEAGVSVHEGSRVIAQFFGGYPALKRAIYAAIAEAEQHGHVRTLLKRYLHIPDIHHPVKLFREGAKRKAWNYKIQGSAAELLKMSMILMDRDEKLRSMDVSMRLQIHDEIVFYMPKGVGKKAKPIIDDYMSCPYRHFGFKDLLCKTPGELGIGENWEAAKAA